MAKISKYAADSTIAAGDKLLGTDATTGFTKSYTLSDIGVFLDATYDTDTTYTAGDGLTLTGTDFDLDAGLTTVTSVVNTGLEIGRDADNRIKFGTDNQIIFEVSGGDNVIMKASGEIEATSLDISGDADIDGTLETDALTIGGSAISLDHLNDAKIDSNSIFLGSIPGNLDGAADSVVIGYRAGYALTSAGNSILIGKDAGKAVTAQNHNIFIGAEAGVANTLGTNIGIGSAALESSTSASDNVAVGHSAGSNLETGDNNIYIGRDTRAGAVDAANEVVVGNQATGKGSNTVLLDNGVNLGSAALSFKDGYFDGSLLCTQNLRRTVTTASESSGTHTITLVDNDNFNIAVTNAATTIALVVATENIGQSGMITITNPASVGSLSFVALPSYMLTPEGATVNFVTTANAVSIISYYVLATDKVLVNYVGNFA
jgi:hypothetical protein